MEQLRKDAVRTLTEYRLSFGSSGAGNDTFKATFFAEANRVIENLKDETVTLSDLDERFYTEWQQVTRLLKQANEGENWNATPHNVACAINAAKNVLSHALYALNPDKNPFRPDRNAF